MNSALPQTFSETSTEELTAYLQQQVARIGGIDRSQVDAERPLNCLGFDSLMAMELRDAIFSELEVEIPLPVILEDASIASLLKIIQSELQKPKSAAATLIPASPEQLPKQRYSLSQGQHGLWFLFKLAPESAAYNLAFTARIRSPLNVTALQQACQRLIDRHPTLRTTYGQEDGAPFQEIHPFQALEFTEIDASAWDEETLRREAIAVYQRPFNLESGPVLRATLLTKSAEDRVFLLAIHHIAVDGVSFGILLDELQQLYLAAALDRPISLPAIEYRYTDFLQWQQDLLAGAGGEELWHYWQQKLAGASPLMLPTDRPYPEIQSHRAASHSFEIPSTLTDRLRALAKAEGVTLYVTLLAAFQVWLYRHSGQEDLVVGTVASGRTESKFVKTVGFFINAIALRTSLAGNPTFTQLIERSRGTVLEALAHQSYPAPLAIERLGINRDLSQPGLFRASFNLLNLSKIAGDFELSVSSQGARVEWGDLVLEPFEIPQQEGQNDFTFDVMETSDRLVAICRYSTDLFDAATIEGMSDRFLTLLAGIAANPQQPIAKLPLLTDAETQQLVTWGAPTAAYPQGLSVCQLIEKQVARTPNAIAVVGDGEMLTYGELNAKANQLARYLRGQGIAPEVRVGICLERSPSLSIAVLGVLKAGGAYVPLDPNYPPDRLSFMLKDAKVKLLLTEAKLLEMLPTTGIQAICLDLETEAIARENTANPTYPVQSENLAYIIYTSGSTGKPKGVAIEHQSWVNAYFAWHDAYQLPSLSCHLQMANFSFDVFAGDFIRALSSGAKLVLCPTDLLLEAELLYGLMQQAAIDTAEFSPAVLRHLMQYLRRAGKRLDFMRLLAVGSDVFYIEEYRQLQQLCAPETRIINSYGASEATIDSSYFEGTAPSEGDIVPIGRPFANTRLYVLDPHLQLVPPGVTGELYIGGAGLARGYLDRPELTAARFTDVELGGTQERLYRTGDLARYLSDGNLAYLGRSDLQVKLRGIRIELGEIESILKQHPAVWQSAATIWKDDLGIESLVAYVVLEPEREVIPVQMEIVANSRSNPLLDRASAIQNPAWYGLHGEETSPRPASAKSKIQNGISIADLRAFLKPKLPDRMLPNAIMVLDALPLNANGKIDRRALPAPDRRSQVTDTGFVPPRNPIERRMAEIWQDILKLDKVGIHDHFFELGGHSLIATQAIARFRQAFSTELPLRCLFESPTIAQLAALVESSFDRQPVSMAPAIEPAVTNGELPLSFAQESLWFLDRLDGIGSTYNMPVVLRLTGKLDVAVLERTLTALIQRHAVLCTTFPTQETRPVQEIAREVSFRLPVVNLSESADTELESFLQQELQQPFNLATDLPFRATLLQSSQTDWVLAIVLHHIAADGWSIEILARELGILYAAFLKQQPSPLPPLPIQYADFALWQRRYLQGEVLSSLLAHWQRILMDAPPVLSLPVDYPRPAVQTFNGQSASFQLDANLTEALKSLSQQSQVTSFMTLFAAFNVLLYRYTGQDDLVVGTPIANRNRNEIAPLIGYFVNILVLRTDLSGNPTFRELLARVYRVALDAYTYQDLPFEKLVESLHPERSLSHPPLFQVMFALHNAPAPELELPDLTIRGIDVDSTTSKFDLTLALRETPAGWQGFVEYNTDLFKPETIDRLMGHYQVLLQAIAANPELRLSEISLLPDGERQLLARWSLEKADYPQKYCIHQLFEERAALSPDAIALVWETQQLTYRELNDRANQLARYLQERGVSPEVRVGICLERSPSLLVAVLGVLKAGGAYVPLDPNYPPDRLAFMLADAETAVLLTRSDLLAKLPPTDVPLVCLDRDREAIEKLSSTNLTSAVRPENLAYIIYTSGSTGKAKGVAIEHRSLVNAYFAWNDAYRLPTLCCHLQMASFSFDVFAGDWTRALCSGAKLVLCPSEWLLEPELLYGLMVREKIDAAEFSPAVLRLLMAYLQRSGEKLDFMKLLVVGSDAFYVREYRQLQQLCAPETRIVNSYGVSEATIDSIYFETKRADLLHEGLVPIGRPFANTQIHLLNADLQPVPIGVTGEIYIGGAGLARGYLNRPDLDRERFISPSPSLRLYRTGDLARYLPDGTIELLGRCDRQVKLRGFRIEIGEIENIANDIPDIKEAVVVLNTEKPGDERLVAYVVPQDSVKESLNVAALRRLREKLPNYMVPATFVLLEKMPLSPNGKVDRRALPAPEIASNELTDSFAAPQSAIEIALAEIWTEILQRSPIGVNDNFFDLGGHSLLATSLVYRIRQAFAIDFPLRALFATPTIAELSPTIAELQADASDRLPACTPISALNRTAGTPAPLSLSQQYIWQMHRADETGSSLNSSIFVKFKGYLTPEILERSVNEILRRHEILRTVFTIINDRPMQVALPSLSLSCTDRDLQHLPLEMRQSAALELAIDLAERPFDLFSAPLMRVALFKLEAAEYLVSIAMHHIITDGWSFGLLLKELEVLIRSDAPLPDLPCQYADFACWQQQAYNEAAIAKQLAYWHRKLVEERPVEGCTREHPLSSNQAGHYFTSFSEATARTVESLSRSLGVTSFTILLAAFKLALAKATKEREILVVATVGNRTVPGTENTIGCFINDVILRSHLLAEDTGATWMRKLQDTVNEAIDCKEVPLPRVIEQTKRFRPLNLLASITMTPAAIASDEMSSWEPIDLKSQAQRWEKSTSELYSIGATPLELYIERSREIKIIVNYSIKLFSKPEVERLFADYQQILVRLANRPDAIAAEFLEEEK